MQKYDFSPEKRRRTKTKSIKKNLRKHHLTSPEIPLKKKAATYSPTSTQYHRRDRA